MKPYESIDQIGGQSLEGMGEVTPEQAMVRLYLLFSKWVDSGCPVRVYQMENLQPQAQPEQLVSADPPEEIKQLMRLLFSKYEGRPIPASEQVVEAKEIPAPILRAMNEFASQVTKREANIKAVFGAGACGAAGIAGNLVVTDSGNQCWQSGNPSW